LRSTQYFNFFPEDDKSHFIFQEIDYEFSSISNLDFLNPFIFFKLVNFEYPIISIDFHNLTLGNYKVQQIYLKLDSYLHQFSIMMSA
jgi:hypothetical protein